MRSWISPLLIGCISVPATAVPLYNQDGNRFSLGGYASIALTRTEGETELVNTSSRVNFTFNRNLINGWQAEAKVEWAFNPVDRTTSVTLSGDTLQATQEDTFIYNRLGYIAFEHELYGRFSVGKQWSVYYDVAQYTDNFVLTGGLALGVYNLNTDGGLSGTGRANKTLQYRFDWQGFDIGLQYQARGGSEVDIVVPTECEGDGVPAYCDQLIAEADELQVEYNDAFGAMIGYEMDDWYLGLAVNAGDITNSIEGGTDSDTAWVATVKYGDLSKPGFYAALSYAQTEAHELDNLGRVFDAKGGELMLAWMTDYNLRFVAGWNRLESSDTAYQDENGKYRNEFFVVGTHYFWGKGFMAYLEGKIDNSQFDSTGTDGSNLVGLGLRYFF